MRRKRSAESRCVGTQIRLEEEKLERDQNQPVSRKKAPINRGVLEFEGWTGAGSKQPSDVPPFLQYDHFGGSPHFILERNLASN